MYQILGIFAQQICININGAQIKAKKSFKPLYFEINVDEND